MEKSEAVVLTDIKREAEESAEDVSSKAKGKNGKNGQAGKGSSSKSKTEKKSKKAVKNVEAEGKKRKRIRVFSDSEDSDNGKFAFSSTNNFKIFACSLIKRFFLYRILWCPISFPDSRSGTRARAGGRKFDKGGG